MHPVFPICEGILTHMSLAESNWAVFLGGKPINHLVPMKEPTQSSSNCQKDMYFNLQSHISRICTNVIHKKTGNKATDDEIN